MKNDLSKMMCLDLYLSALSKKEYNRIKPLLEPPENFPMPLMSWDISGQEYQRKIQKAQKENDLKKLLLFAEKYNWSNSLSEILQDRNYEALVLTDASQKIVWVNKGFSEMTGYSANFAINRSPSFLSGPETSTVTRQNIAKKIQAGSPFKEVIINYRKNKEKYNCELNIFPLYRENITHYLALERQVS